MPRRNRPALAHFCRVREDGRLFFSLAAPGNMKLVLVALLCCLIVEASAEQTTVGTQEPRIMKTLVVYYSLTGKTDAVAQALARELSADVRRVEDVEKPSVGWWFIITHALSAIRGVEAQIKPIDTGFQGYDRVFVGSPVWGGSPSTPINAFIAKADFTGKDVIPFMTMGGNDASGALKKMSERIEKKGGKIIGSFAFSSKSATNEALAAKAREMAQRFR